MKRKYINIIILISVILIFMIEYYLITSYIERMFRYTAIEVKNEVINSEIENFKDYLIKNIIFLLLQSLAMFFCLNIGFLYFKIKANFRNLFDLVIFSFLAVLINHFIIIIIVKLNNWTFTTNSINSASEKLNLENYINVEEKFSWIALSLSSINLEQLIILVLLGIGIYKIVKIDYKKAFSITLKTYGLGIFFWFVFALVMEMNFS